MAKSVRVHLLFGKDFANTHKALGFVYKGKPGVTNVLVKSPNGIGTFCFSPEEGFFFDVMSNSRINIMQALDTLVEPLNLCSSAFRKMKGRGPLAICVAINRNDSKFLDKVVRHLQSKLGDQYNVVGWL